MTDTNLHDQGSFVSGFVLGMCVGATGYFLFGTDKGITVRQKILDEWEDAKAEMSRNGVTAHSQMSLREFLQTAVKQATGVSIQVSKMMKPLQTQTHHHAHHRKALPLPSIVRKTATPSKFRGT